MKRIFTSFVMVLLMVASFAQTPQKMSYQAVVRNSDGVLAANTELPVIVSILQGSADGVSVYTETHQVTTNANGLMSLEIGAGVAEGDNDFSSIDWADGPYFIMTQVIVDGQPIVINSELMSVPYAMHAESAESVPGMENFATKTEVAETYATKNEVAETYATKQTLEENYLKLENYSEVSLDGYVTQDELSTYAKSSDLDNYLKVEDYNEVSLDGYVMAETLNDTLSAYVKTEDLPVVPSVENLATKDTLAYYPTAEKLNNTLSAYVKTEDLPEIPNVENLATKDTLSFYAKTTDVPTTVAAMEDADNYIQQSDLAEWAKAEEKPSYDYSEIANTPEIPSVENLATKDTLAYYPTAEKLNDTLSAYVKIEDLLEIPSVENLATKDTLAYYPTAEKLNDTLSAYVKTEDLPEIPSVENLATKDTLAYYAKTADVPTTVAAMADADNYLQQSDLAEWAKADEKPSYDYSEIANTPEIPSVDGLASEEFVSDTLAYYTKTSGLSAVATSGSYTDLSNTPSLSTVATSGSYADLTDTPSIPSVDGLASEDFVGDTLAYYTKTSGLSAVATSGSYTDLSNTPSLSTVATSGSYADLTDKPSIPSVDGLASEEFVGDTLAYYTKTSGLSAVATSGSYTDLSNSPSLSTVATSGSYADLTDKPSIPSVDGLASVEYVRDTLELFLQSGDISAVATSGSYTDLTDKPSIPSVDGLASEEFVGDTLSYYTKTATLSAVATSGSYADLTDKPSIPSVDGLASEEFVGDTLAYYTKTSGLSAVATSGSYTDLSNSPSLSTVATSGSYADLTDKPSIPSVDGLASVEYVRDTLELFLQSGDISAVATSGSYTDLTDKPSIPSVDGLASEEFVSDTLSYYTKTATLSAVATSGSYADLTDKPSIPSVDGLASEDFVGDTLAYYTKTSGLSAVATSGSYTDLTDKPSIPSVDGLASVEYVRDTLELFLQSGDISAVATSGSYTDLTDKPSIPSVDGLASEEFVSDTLSYYAKTADVPTTVAAMADADNYLQQSDLAEWAKADEKPSYDYNEIANTPEIPSVENLATKDTLSYYLKSSDAVSIDGLASEEYVGDTLAYYTKTTDLAGVATTGDYADLTNTPTNVSEFTNDAEYITKAEFDAMKASYESQILGMRADMTPNTIYKGALLSKFSVSADKQVVFSQGNLQYQPSTGIWRFATNQYDAVGGTVETAVAGNVYETIDGVVTKCSNYYANDPTYKGWIDLFCFGTSGWSGSGASEYLPTSHNQDTSLYLQENMVGDYAQADWGVYNAIENGGKKSGMWRTMKREEWLYLFNERDNASALFSLATITLDAVTADGVSTVVGFVFLPDDWGGCPDGCTFNTVTSTIAGTNTYTFSDGFEANEYTESQWRQMQDAGAVFFPHTCVLKVKGGDYKLSNSSDKPYAAYWTSNSSTRISGGSNFKNVAGWFSIDYKKRLQATGFAKNVGLGVRLVRDIE